MVEEDEKTPALDAQRSLFAQLDEVTKKFNETKSKLDEFNGVPAIYLFRFRCLLGKLSHNLNAQGET